MSKLLKRFYSILAFTGLYLPPFLCLFLPHAIPGISSRQTMIINLVLIAWTSFNNFWAVACEGKQLDEIHIGDGLVLETGLKKESPQKRIAMYPKVPPKLLSKEPEGIILGKYKNQYVRVPLKDIYHYCILGGTGVGKSSGVLLNSLLANFAGGKNGFTSFSIDIKGELHEVSSPMFNPDVIVVDPENRDSCGWDVYYRLHNHPSNDLILAAIEEISEGLIVSTNSKDFFFVENAKTALTGLLVYYYMRGESFIDSVNRILESDTASLITEIIKDSEPSDLWYKYLAKFNGKTAESVQDIFTEMCTSLSVFSKDSVRFCFRDNYQKASPYSLLEGKSVFLSIKEDMLETYKAIMRLCTVQVFKELERRPKEQKKPILLIIDEFARIGEIKGVFNALYTLRSRNVMVLLAFQSLAQAEQIYGDDGARILMDNCRVKVILECNDPKTQKAISDWCGTYRDKKETLNGGKNRHKSYTYEDKPIVDANDLIKLAGKGEEILVLGGIGYLRTIKCPYFRDEKLKALADQVKAHNNKLNEVKQNER